jgi:hypothetical protein
MQLQFRRHESVSLKELPEFSERWLHDRICEDTSMLGLGELEVIDRERPQEAGGRLDIVLTDADGTVRYEVEIMLGPKDPSHLIRCIEYWDVERRRYPAYDHVAVLIAEQITSRFLNVMSLLAGSIPLVAIQLNALRVGNDLVMDFVKVLDQRALRQDDTVDTGGEEVDRSAWEARVGVASLEVCDRILQLANQQSSNSFDLKFRKRHIAITSGGSFFNALAFHPRRKWTRLIASLPNAIEWKQRFDDAGLPASVIRGGTRLLVTLTVVSLEENKPLVTELVHHAVQQYLA